MVATAHSQPKYLWRISRTFFRIALVLGLVAVVAYIVLSASPSGLVAPRRAKVFYECSALQRAVMSYYTEYGTMPDASNNTALIETLMGNVTPSGHPVVARDNPRGIAFFSPRLQDFNDKGELIDPWGTPYHIAIDAKSEIHVRSAGPDKIFGTADDITNQ